MSKPQIPKIKRDKNPNLEDALPMSHTTGEAGLGNESKRSSGKKIKKDSMPEPDETLSMKDEESDWMGSLFEQNTNSFSSNEKDEKLYIAPLPPFIPEEKKIIEVYKQNEPEELSKKQEPVEYRPTTPSNMPPVPIDPGEIKFMNDYSCFFMFGVSFSGKSAILSGLFYNLYAHKILAGHSIEKTNDLSIPNQQEGTILLNELLAAIPRKEFPRRTQELNPTKPLPKQINHVFRPKDPRKPVFKFSILDISGEDLEKVDPAKNYGGKLKSGIDVFLKLPENNLAFICVIPAVVPGHMDEFELSNYILNFLNTIDLKGHRKCPILFIVSKWDTMNGVYSRPEDFLKENMPLIWAKMHEADRDVSIMSFSLGEVETKGHQTKIAQFKPENSEKLFNWMYKTQMGVDLDEPVSKSLWNKLWK
jgi:hypothetical protein